MTGRNTRQKGDETKDSDGKGRDYEVIIKKVTQMEKVIDENSRKWKEMVNEMKELKDSLTNRIDKETEDEKDRVGLSRKFELMTSKVTELSGTIDGLRKTNEGLIEQNKALKQQVQVIVEENVALRERLIISEERGKEQGQNLVKLQHEQEGWARVQEEKIVDFREIINQQEMERKNNLEKQVIKVIKSKENVVRDVVEKKKSVMIFGLKEKVVNFRSERLKEEMKVAKEVIQEVDKDNTEAAEEIEEVYRLGKYAEGKDRPMKIIFRIQVAVTKILERTWRLAQTEKYKGVWIRKDLNEEERARMNELINEAKTKNEQRTEEEKNRFY